MNDEFKMDFRSEEEVEDEDLTADGAGEAETDEEDLEEEDEDDTPDTGDYLTEEFSE